MRADDNFIESEIRLWKILLLMKISSITVQGKRQLCECYTKFIEAFTFCLENI